MNVLAVITVLAAVCAVGLGKTCKELDEKLDKDVDVIDFVVKFNNTLYLYSSLADNMVCGVAAFDETKTKFLFTPPGSETLIYEYTKIRDGEWAKTLLPNGKRKIRKIFNTINEKCGGLICAYTCDEAGVAEAVDCYLTSTAYITDAEKAIAYADITTPETKKCTDIKTIPKNDNC